MKLLVTGASGLLGSKLCNLAVRKKHQVYSVYDQHRPLLGTPIRVNISDKTAVEETFKHIKPVAAVHAAALTDVDKCELEKDLAWKINVEGTRNIAESCKKHHVFLIYVSTDYVFNGEKGMYREDDKPAPINYYGLTKLEGEESVKDLANEYCIARTSATYGSIPATGKVNFALWLLDKLRRKEEVKIVTDQWNSPTLNTNLAAMLLEVLERKLTGTLHVAGATRLNRYEFAELLAQGFSLDTSLITPVSSSEISWIAHRPRDSSISVEKASQTLKNRPLEIEEALEKMKKEM
jgi:dTDP-4-dehydrorhamnose reductase